MNRRSFFKTLASATAGFAILPAATTYGRVWKAERVVKAVRWVPNPEWFEAQYVMTFIGHNLNLMPTDQLVNPEFPAPRYNRVNGVLVPVHPFISQ